MARRGGVGSADKGMASCRSGILSCYYPGGLLRCIKVESCAQVNAFCLLHAFCMQNGSNESFLLQTPMGRQRLRQMVCQSEIEKRK